MRPTRAEQLAKAKEALVKGRDLTKLMVCPGPRGVDTVRNGLRSTGRHLYWYIGEFLHRPGITGPVACEEVPTFRTKREASEFLAEVMSM